MSRRRGPGDCETAWLILLQLVGMGVFVLGFFLTRFEMPHVSMCEDGVAAHAPQSNSSNGCWYPQRYERAVVVVIDALRLDFAYSEPSLQNNKVCVRVCACVCACVCCGPQLCSFDGHASVTLMSGAACVYLCDRRRTDRSSPCCKKWLCRTHRMQPCIASWQIHRQ